jgi:hypothetical protein
MNPQEFDKIMDDIIKSCDNIIEALEKRIYNKQTDESYNKQIDY